MGKRVATSGILLAATELLAITVVIIIDGFARLGMAKGLIYRIFLAAPSNKRTMEVVI